MCKPSEWKPPMAQKETIMKRSTIAKTFTAAAFTALAIGLAPTANADDKGCSNATLKGTFAYIGTGFNVTPASAAGPFAEVGTQTFDGKGATSTTFTASANGNIFQVTLAGTYSVNPDCTGTFNLAAPAIGITIPIFFVIGDGGNEFKALETLPGVVVTRLGRRQFPVGDWRQ